MVRLVRGKYITHGENDKVEPLGQPAVHPHLRHCGYTAQLSGAPLVLKVGTSAFSLTLGSLMG